MDENPLFFSFILRIIQDFDIMRLEGGNNMKRVLRLSIFAILIGSVLLLASCAPRSALSAYKKLAKEGYEVDLDFANKNASKYNPTIQVTGTKT